MKVDEIYNCESDYYPIKPKRARARSVFSCLGPVGRSASLYSGINRSDIIVPESAAAQQNVALHHAHDCWAVGLLMLRQPRLPADAAGIDALATDKWHPANFGSEIYR
jgi:hypothetical protein